MKINTENILTEESINGPQLKSFGSQWSLKNLRYIVQIRQIGENLKFGSKKLPMIALTKFHIMNKSMTNIRTKLIYVLLTITKLKR